MLHLLFVDVLVVGYTHGLGVAAQQQELLWVELNRDVLRLGFALPQGVCYLHKFEIAV